MSREYPFEQPPHSHVRPKLFSGREWLRVLVEQYGENLKGLSLAELEKLPDTGWVQPEQKPSLLEKVGEKLGLVATKHPSQPGFRFDDCPDFFDGKSYLNSLVQTYGEDLEHLPVQAIRNLPILETKPLDNPDINSGYLKYVSPAEAIELERGAYEFFLPAREERSFVD